MTSYIGRTTVSAEENASFVFQRDNCSTVTLDTHDVLLIGVHATILDLEGLELLSRVHHIYFNLY